MKRLAVAAALLLLTAGSSCDKQDPKPQESSICGTTPDGLIWCPVPAQTGDPMPTMHPGQGGDK